MDEFDKINFDIYSPEASDGGPDIRFVIGQIILVVVVVTICLVIATSM